MNARNNKLSDRLHRMGERVKHSRTVRKSRIMVHRISMPRGQGVPLYDIAVYLWRGIFNGNLWRASKGLAFSFLTALPPLLIFIFTLIAFLPFDGLQDELLYELQLIVPEKIYGPIANTINDVMGHKHTSLLSIGSALSVIFAANGLYSMMAYFTDRHTEQRSVVVSYLICIALVNIKIGGNSFPVEAAVFIAALSALGLMWKYLDKSKKIQVSFQEALTTAIIVATASMMIPMVGWIYRKAILQLRRLAGKCQRLFYA